MAAKEFLAQNNVYVDDSGNITFDKQTIEKSIKRITATDYDLYSRLLALSSAVLNVKPSFQDGSRQKVFDEKAFAVAGKTGQDYFGLIRVVHKLGGEDPAYWQFIQKQNENYLQSFRLLKPNIDLNNLMPYSFFIQFQFTLAKPFISRDDEPFYIIENPVKKDKVFKVPMMSASGWKGNLRWAADKNLVDSFPNNMDEVFERRLQLIRLFGNENDAINRYFNGCISQKLFNKKDKKEVDAIDNRFKEYLEQQIPATKEVAGFQGRLYFYPTFFDKIDLEVINPHDRETRAGKNPIYFEVVPATATGTFTLLWFPFDLVESPAARQQAFRQDWAVLKDALKTMFFTYGFSAKKSSGFGVIEKSICDKRLAIAGTNVDLREDQFGDFDDFLKTIDARVKEVADV